MRADTGLIDNLDKKKQEFHGRIQIQPRISLYRQFKLQYNPLL
jgi:hypothetical protein